MTIILNYVCKTGFYVPWSEDKLSFIMLSMLIAIKPLYPWHSGSGGAALHCACWLGRKFYSMGKALCPWGLFHPGWSMRTPASPLLSPQWHSHLGLSSLGKVLTALKRAGYLGHWVLWQGLSPAPATIPWVSPASCFFFFFFVFRLYRKWLTWRLDWISSSKLHKRHFCTNERLQSI